MSTFVQRTEEFKPSLENRALELANGTQLIVPARAKSMVCGIRDDSITAVKFFNGTFSIPLAVYEGLNLKPLCVECVIAYLNLPPQHIYKPAAPTQVYGVAQR